MYLPFRHRRGLSIPPGLPRLNTAHPLASALQSAWTFDNSGVYDLTGYSGRSSTVYGTPTVGNYLVGSALQLGDACVQMQATHSGPMTFIFLVMRTVTPNPADYVHRVGLYFSTETIAGGRNGTQLLMGNAWGNVDKFYFVYEIGGASYNADAAWISGVKQSGVNPADVTIANNQWYCVGVTFSNLPTGNVNATFGGFSDSWFKPEGIVLALGLAFKGVLPDGAMADLSLDPGQMLLWPDDDIFATAGTQNAIPLVATPGSGNVDIVGQQVGVIAGVAAAPGAGSLAWQGRQPAVAAGVVASPGPGTLAISGRQIAVIAGVAAAPGAGAFVWAGRQPSVITGVVSALGVGGLAWHGHEVTSVIGLVPIPGAGNLNWEGHVPIFPIEAEATPGVGTLLWQGHTPDVSFGDISTYSGRSPMTHPNKMDVVVIEFLPPVEVGISPWLVLDAIPIIINV